MDTFISLDHIRIDTGIKNARVCIGADSWPTREPYGTRQWIEIYIGGRELLNNGFEGRQVTVEPLDELLN